MKCQTRKISNLVSVVSAALTAVVLFTFACGKDDPASAPTTKKKEWMAPPKTDMDLPEGRPLLTDGKYIIQLYQQFKDTKEILEKHGITYWIDGGTLLGAIRHTGVIPWDDDVDIALLPGQESKFLALKSEFNKIGYDIIDAHGVGYGVVLVHNPDSIFRLDVFTMVERDGKYFYKDWPLGYREGEKFYYKKGEVFPLKKYEFGTFMVYGPNSPSNGLVWAYGYEWNTIAIQDRMHRPSVDGFKKVRFNLTEEDRKPAQPIGPLQDRNP